MTDGSEWGSETLNWNDWPRVFAHLSYLLFWQRSVNVVSLPFCDLFWALCSATVLSNGVIVTLTLKVMLPHVHWPLAISISTDGQPEWPVYTWITETVHVLLTCVISPLFLFFFHDLLWSEVVSDHIWGNVQGEIYEHSCYCLDTKLNRHYTLALVARQSIEMCLFSCRLSCTNCD